MLIISVSVYEINYFSAIKISLKKCKFRSCIRYILVSSFLLLAGGKGFKMKKTPP